MTVEQVLKSARELSPEEQRELLRRLATEVVHEDERHPVWVLAEDIAAQLAAAGEELPEPTGSEPRETDSLLEAFSAFADQLADAGIELPRDGAAQHEHYTYGTHKVTLIPG